MPVTTCPIYLRIQPCLAPQPYAAPVAEGETADQALFFLLVLRDPTHKLVHTSLSQSMPAEWLAIPFEENEWVEDVMVDVIGRCVQVIGKAYLHSRMTAQSVAISKAVRRFASRSFNAYALTPSGLRSVRQPSSHSKASRRSRLQHGQKRLSASVRLRRTRSSRRQRRRGSSERVGAARGERSIFLFVLLYTRAPVLCIVPLHEEKQVSFESE